MQTQSKIKIIKRAERDSPQAQTQAVEEPKGDGQRQAVSVRDAVTTITGWIGELRQKKDLDGVWALGDCAAVPDKHTGKH